MSSCSALVEEVGRALCSRGSGAGSRCSAAAWMDCSTREGVCPGVCSTEAIPSTGKARGRLGVPVLGVQCGEVLSAKSCLRILGSLGSAAPMRFASWPSSALPGRVVLPWLLSWARWVPVAAPDGGPESPLAVECSMGLKSPMLRRSEEPGGGERDEGRAGEAEGAAEGTAAA
jgi:hypothetical protein